MIRFAAHSRVLGALRLGLFGFGILAAAFASRAAEAATDARAVLDHYAAIAQAIYEDAHAGAKSLEAAIDAFLKDPTEAKLKAARERDASIPGRSMKG
jgi:putative iron-regulated protein